MLKVSLRYKKCSIRTNWESFIFEILQIKYEEKNP